MSGENILGINRRRGASLQADDTLLSCSGKAEATFRGDTINAVGKKDIEGHDPNCGPVRGCGKTVAWHRFRRRQPCRLGRGRISAATHGPSRALNRDDPGQHSRSVHDNLIEAKGLVSRGWRRNDRTDCDAVAHNIRNGRPMFALHDETDLDRRYVCGRALIYVPEHGKGLRMRDQIQTGLLTLLPRLRRFAISLTGSVTDAEELVQGACERVLNKSDQVRDVARVDSWIYGIMRNLWVDEMRSRRVRRHDDLSEAGDIVGEDGVATTEGRITLAAVRRELATLPEEQRVVLVFVCVDGLSYKEAADILGIPVGTVMSRLSRGRQALYEKLSGENVTIQ